MSQVTERSNLYSKIAGLLQAAKQNVVRAVNQTMRIENPNERSLPNKQAFINLLSNA